MAAVEKIDKLRRLAKDIKVDQSAEINPIAGQQPNRDYFEALMRQRTNKVEQVEDDMVTVPDFNATIAHALGLPLEQELTSPSGRPFTVADKGRPITELFA